jgi:ABC-type multidrug transport system fused ATPase/permease subunit
MDYSCPLCKADLSHRRLKKVRLGGESSWLALRWRLECPECKGAIKLRQHRIEGVIVAAVFISPLWINYFARASGFKGLFVSYLATVALLCIGAFAFTFLQMVSFGVIGENVTLIMRKALYSSILSKNIGWFDNKDNSPGQLSSTMATEA